MGWWNRNFAIFHVLRCPFLVSMISPLRPEEKRTAKNAPLPTSSLFHLPLVNASNRFSREELCVWKSDELEPAVEGGREVTDNWANNAKELVFPASGSKIYGLCPVSARFFTDQPSMCVCVCEWVWLRVCLSAFEWNPSDVRTLWKEFFLCKFSAWPHTELRTDRLSKAESVEKISLDHLVGKLSLPPFLSSPLLLELSVGK